PAKEEAPAAPAEKTAESSQEKGDRQAAKKAAGKAAAKKTTKKAARKSAGKSSTAKSAAKKGGAKKGSGKQAAAGGRGPTFDAAAMGLPVEAGEIASYMTQYPGVGPKSVQTLIETFGPAGVYGALE